MKNTCIRIWTFKSEVQPSHSRQNPCKDDLNDSVSVWETAGYWWPRLVNLKFQDTCALPLWTVSSICKKSDYICNIYSRYDRCVRCFGIIRNAVGDIKNAYFPFLSSNIPSSPAYGVFISQLIRYARASSSYECFILRVVRLSNRLLGQGYVKERLRSSLRKFYGRYEDLIKQY